MYILRWTVRWHNSPIAVLFVDNSSNIICCEHHEYIGLDVGPSHPLCWQYNRSAATHVTSHYLSAHPLAIWSWHLAPCCNHVTLPKVCIWNLHNCSLVPRPHPHSARAIGERTILQCELANTCFSRLPSRTTFEKISVWVNLPNSLFNLKPSSNKVSH